MQTERLQIITERLILNAATMEILNAELTFLKDPTQQEGFAQALGAAVVTWPPLYYDATNCAQMLWRLSLDPRHFGWGPWHVLLCGEQQTPILVASAGFHAPPDEEGVVEIGYSVIEAYQRQGIAPEMVRALVGWAFSHPQVSKVIITTLATPALEPSAKVARKCGFRFVGTEKGDEGTILVFVFTREDFAGE